MSIELHNIVEIVVIYSPRSVTRKVIYLKIKIIVIYWNSPTSWQVVKVRWNLATSSILFCSSPEWGFSQTVYNVDYKLHRQTFEGHCYVKKISFGKIQCFFLKKVMLSYQIWIIMYWALYVYVNYCWLTISNKCMFSTVETGLGINKKTDTTKGTHSGQELIRICTDWNVLLNVTPR